MADISPPTLTSVLLFPQKSQAKDMTIISLKKGIDVLHILFSPSFPQALHGTLKIKASPYASSWIGLDKSALWHEIKLVFSSSIFYSGFYIFYYS